MKLIVFLITGLGFISCKSTYPVYKQLINREIKHYGVNFKDTILDLGQDQMFMDELTSIEVDSLYFLGPSRDQDSTKPFSGFVSRVVFAQRNIDSVFISGLYHNVSTKFGDYYFSNVPNSIKSSNTLFVGGIGMKIENFISASIVHDKIFFCLFVIMLK